MRQIAWASKELSPSLTSINYGPPFRRKVTDSGYGPYIAIYSWKAAGLRNGERCVATYYA